METLESGMFAVDHAARTVRGRLVPWGERSRTSIDKTRPLTFPAGSVRIPRDPSIVTLNRNHDQFAPVGRAVVLEDDGAGIVATFRIADTEDGDAWLADAAAFVKLSAEVARLTRNPDDTASADLTGAALCTEGAFRSAALFAIDADEDEDDDAGDDAGVAEDDDAESGDDEETSTEDDDTEGETDVVEATASDTMTAARSRRPKLTRAGFMSALFTAYTSGDARALTPYTASTRGNMFALTDVLYDDTSGGLVAGWPASWLGELWAAVPDARPFLDSVNIGTLTGMKAAGWRVIVPDEAVAEWDGNKTDVPSAPIAPAVSEFDAIRLAGANDIAREFWDFGRMDVIDAYTRGMVAVYKKKSDGYALAQTVVMADTVTLGTVPADVNPALAALYDLLDTVQANGGTPNLIRVAPDVARSLALELDGNQLAYVSGSAGVGAGDFYGTVYRQDARLAAGQILVADKRGIGAWELPGSPIRVDALSIANGGVDRGFFGYIAAGVTDPQVVVKASLPAA